jgi:hypothetical protein
MGAELLQLASKSSKNGTVNPGDFILTVSHSSIVADFSRVTHLVLTMVIAMSVVWLQTTVVFHWLGPKRWNASTARSTHSHRRPTSYRRFGGDFSHVNDPTEPNRSRLLCHCKFMYTSPN